MQVHCFNVENGGMLKSIACILHSLYFTFIVRRPVVATCRLIFLRYRAKNTTKGQTLVFLSVMHRSLSVSFTGTRYPMCGLWTNNSRLIIRGFAVRIPPSDYAPRQGILSTIASLDPGVVNGYLAGIFIL